MNTILNILDALAHADEPNDDYWIYGLVRRSGSGDNQTQPVSGYADGLRCLPGFGCVVAHFELERFSDERPRQFAAPPAPQSRFRPLHRSLRRVATDPVLTKFQVRFSQLQGVHPWTSALTTGPQRLVVNASDSSSHVSERSTVWRWRYAIFCARA